MAKLTLPDGQTLDEAEVEREFAEAMAAPAADEPQAKAPARKDGPDPGEERAAPPDDKARTTSATRTRRTRRSTGKAEPKATVAQASYKEPVSEFLQALTIVAAVTPLPETPLAVRVRLQGLLVEEHRGGLTAAIDSAAQHNAVIRRGVEAVTMGSAGWILPAVLAVAPFAAASLTLWRIPITEADQKAAKGFQAEMRAAIETMGASDAGVAA